VNLRNLIIGLYTVLFVAVGLWAVVFFLQIHRELTGIRAQEAANQRHLEAAKAKLAEQQAYLEKLKNDPALLERIIRQKLGYARPGEFIFRFENEPTN
jgi:cell division protein FtsB